MNFTTIQAAIRSRAPQIYKVMKLTTFLLIIALVQASAKSFSQKITLHETKAPLEKVITTIKQQSGYEFLYLDQDLKKETITVQVTNASIDDALKACFNNTNVDYKIVGNNIVLKKTEPNFLDNIKNKIKAELAQVTVSGKITDETGKPLLGVTVKIKDTNSATATDSKGFYSLVVPDDKTIISFSFIGFETQELAAKDIPTGSIIKLKATETNLKEVVVNKGYYNTTKELNTGSVSTVTAKDLSNQPVSNLLNALEGKVPGLYIQQSSGIPGAGVTVRLRGKNSIANGNDPLYIIDGVPFTSSTISSTYQSIIPLASPFNDIDLNNIESIDVLKDADATAIYGSRGANGVILITTKKGKAGKTKLDVNASTGAGSVTRMMPLLNTQQYLQMRHQALKNDGVKTIPANAYDINGMWDTTRYTNWQKALIGGTSNITNVNAAISGGNNNTQFIVGGTFHREGTVYPGDFADKKGAVNFNLNHTSDDQKFKFSISTNYLIDNNSLPQVDLTSIALSLAPDAPPLYANDGNLNWQNSTWTNPLSNLLLQYNIKSTNLIGNATLSYELVKGLVLKSNLGYTNFQTNEIQASPIAAYDPVYLSYGATGSSIFINNAIKTWIAEPEIQYQKDALGGHINALLGASFQRTIQSGQSFSASGYTNDNLLNSIVAAPSIRALNQIATQYSYNAIYARLNYDYKEKYLINLTARRDGSSRFGPGKQFANFGAIGAGWIFSKESFVTDNLPFLSFGKFRGSYGTTGSDQITDYQFLSTYTSTSLPYQGTSGLLPSRLENPDFAWETSKKFEAALELGFFRDNILFDIDYFRNKTGNQLVGYPLPGTTGFTSIQYNLPAIVENYGWEFNLSTTNFKNKDFSWRTGFNLTIPENRLVSYPNLTSSSYANQLTIGQSIFSRKFFNVLGVNPTTGVYQFTDSKGNPTYSPTWPGDLQVVKNIGQQFYGGLSNAFQYHQFQLDVFFQFVKQTGYNYLYTGFGAPPGFANTNQPIYVLNGWQKPGDVNNIQQYTQSGSSSAGKAYNNLHNYGADIVSDASFIRLKNISLSYDLSSQLVQRLKLRKVKIYIQGQNLFTITNYLGLDPENQNATALPPLKVINAGFQITL